jgi:phosphatidylserine/phosphatidylglycerophosphate/cardiolipin synthase-like enzyme
MTVPPPPAALRWFLQFTSANPALATGDGRPWADGTEMARRARQNPPAVPWDNGCIVTDYVDGLTAMSAMRDALETVIAYANANVGNLAAGWPRGRVYIAGWRFNCLRDLSVNNAWGTDPWTAYLDGNQATLDQTAMGLVVRLLQAGVMVRIMVWLPTGVQQGIVGRAHVVDHFLAADIVRLESSRLSTGGGDPLGVVALDTRTAEIWSGSHHQKMMVIRSPAVNVAFVGGVDFALTRRSSLDPALTAPSGDWQSGQMIPDPARWWPRQAPGQQPVDYRFRGQGADAAPAMTDKQATDLPEKVYGDSSSPGARQMWHDQHLKLEGSIVKTIEHQFCERWIDQTKDIFGQANLFDLDQRSNWTTGQVIFSTSLAYKAGTITPLPEPAPVQLPPGTEALTQVQMWRTIPLRARRTGPPFERGEFTVMAGIANAVKQARELIWMFDQYFWNVPLARLLNARLRSLPGLRLILILPPFSDSSDGEGWQHLARNNALGALTDGLPSTNNVLDQVGVYNMWYGRWQPPGNATNRGVYVHAKCHTYDDSLLVCGSANLNRRSFLCDTELACAVLSATGLVAGHQRDLWAQFFPPSVAWPVNINRAAAGWGAQFFTQFQAAANIGNSYLIPDPWQQQPPRLPNNVERQVDEKLPVGYDDVYDPSSVNLVRLEQPVRVTASLQRAPQLDDIVMRLEMDAGNMFGPWPYRRQL